MKKNLTSWLIAALIAALGMLLFTLPGHAAQVTVLICELDKKCTVETARIYFVVPVESSLPAECLKTGEKKAAEVADLIAKTEFVRTDCESR